MIVNETIPTIGTAATWVHRGTKAISAKAMPASEPRSPARRPSANLPAKRGQDRLENADNQ